MYTCVRALLRLRGDNQRLTEANVGEAKVRTLLNENSVAILVLTNPAVTHELSLDLTTVTDLIFSVAADITVNDWLQALGNASLPTSDTVPVKTASYAKCNDLFAAGYHAEKVHPLAGAGSQMPDDEMTDILVTKAGVDYKQFFENCLVTMNGLFHLTDYSTAGVKIRDGGKTHTKSNMHELSIISFKDVGKVNCYPVKPENIIKQPGRTLSQGFIINLPDVDVGNKVVMLSIGGYLYTLNYCYKVTGDHNIKVDYWRIPFEERYFNSKDIIDMTPFTDTIVRNPNHGDALDMTQAMSDESIIAFMGLSQTFVITIDADNYYVENHALERTGLFGRYYTYERPDFPLLLESGFMPAYYAIPETEAYVICIPDNYVRRYAHNTRPPTDDHYFNQGLISYAPAYEGAGYLMEIGTEVLADPV